MTERRQRARRRYLAALRAIERDLTPTYDAAHVSRVDMQKAVGRCLMHLHDARMPEHDDAVVADLPSGHTIAFEHFRYARADVEAVRLGLASGAYEDLPEEGHGDGHRRYLAFVDSLRVYPAHEVDEEFAGQHGGRTVAHVVNADGETVAVGLARCSVLDTFSRPKGRLIARGRALKSLRQSRLESRAS